MGWSSSHRFEVKGGKPQAPVSAIGETCDAGIVGVSFDPDP
jgi:hypothetical protein